MLTERGWRPMDFMFCLASDSVLCPYASGRDKLDRQPEWARQGSHSQRSNSQLVGLPSTVRAIFWRSTALELVKIPNNLHSNLIVDTPWKPLEASALLRSAHPIPRLFHHECYPLHRFVPQKPPDTIPRYKYIMANNKLTDVLCVSWV